MQPVSLALGPLQKEEEPKVNEQSVEKCGWGPDCPFCKNQEKKGEEKQNSATAEAKIANTPSKMTKNSELD